MQSSDFDGVWCRDSDEHVITGEELLWADGSKSVVKQMGNGVLRIEGKGKVPAFEGRLAYFANREFRLLWSNGSSWTRPSSSGSVIIPLAPDATFPPVSEQRSNLSWQPPDNTFAQVAEQRSNRSQEPLLAHEQQRLREQNQDRQKRPQEQPPELVLPMHEQNMQLSAAVRSMERPQRKSSDGSNPSRRSSDAARPQRKSSDGNPPSRKSSDGGRRISTVQPGVPEDKEERTDLAGLLEYLTQLEQAGAMTRHVLFIKNDWTLGGIIPLEHHGFLIELDAGLGFLSLDFGVRGIMWKRSREQPEFPEGTASVKSYSARVQVQELAGYCQRTKPFSVFSNDCKVWAAGMMDELQIKQAKSRKVPLTQCKRPSASVACGLGALESWL